MTEIDKSLLNFSQLLYLCFKSKLNSICSFDSGWIINWFWFSLSFLLSSAATFKNTSSKVGIEILYDFIFKLLIFSSKFLKNVGISKIFFNFFSSLWSSLIGILNIISSDKISYSTLFESVLINSTIASLSAPSSFDTFKLINLPYFSIKKRGDPTHFIFPLLIIPILFPNTLASSI